MTMIREKPHSITRLIAGCFRFFTFTQCFDLTLCVGAVAALRRAPAVSTPLMSPQYQWPSLDRCGG
jgi:hypothetical protein